MRTDIYAMMTLARQASVKGNSMFLSIPNRLELGAPYRGVGFIPEFLKTRKERS